MGLTEHCCAFSAHKYLKNVALRMKKIIASRVMHHGEERICLKFPYDAELIAFVKQIGNIRWSAQMKAWHLPDNEQPGLVLIERWGGFSK